MIEVGEYIKTKQGNIDKVINNNYYIARYIECERGLIATDWRRIN